MFDVFYRLTLLIVASIGPDGSLQHLQNITRPNKCALNEGRSKIEEGAHTSRSTHLIPARLSSPRALIGSD